MCGPFRPLLASLLLFSCATPQRYIFRDSPISLPGLTEKGDYVLTGRVGGNAPSDRYDAPSLSGFDGQAAYALTNRFSVDASFSGRSGYYAGTGASLFDSAQLWYNNVKWELGGALTLPIRGHAYFAPSAGFGGGVFRIADWELQYDSGTIQKTSTYYYNTRLTQFYVQPAFLFKWDRIDLAFGWRFSMNFFPHVSTNYSDDQQARLWVNGLQGTDLLMDQLFVLLRVYPGTHALHLEFQAGNNETIAAQQYRFYKWNGSMGIGLDLYQWKKERHRHNANVRE